MARRLELDRESGGRMLAEILAGVKQNERSYLLVERDSEIVGEGFTSKSGHHYQTVGLALVKRVSGMGVGTELMWTLEEEARRLGATRLHLTVWSANPAAIRVYNKVGYEECGRRRGWVLLDSGDECDHIDMTKILSTER